MQMKTSIINETDVTPALDQSIRDLLAVAFPNIRDTFAITRRYLGHVPLYNVIIEDQDVLCAHIAVIDRTIRVGSRPLRVAGLALVAVAPAYRGRRLVDVALAAAMQEAARRDFDCGFLFTHSPTDRIYARNNWIQLTQPITVKNEGREILLPP